MTTKQTTPKDIDEYIARYPEDIQEILEKIRMTIREAAPEADERISYQIPTFALEGNLVHFAAYKNRIGFYPTPSGIEEFEEEVEEIEEFEEEVETEEVIEEIEEGEMPMPNYVVLHSDAEIDEEKFKVLKNWLSNYTDSL